MLLQQLHCCSCAAAGPAAPQLVHWAGGASFHSFLNFFIARSNKPNNIGRNGAITIDTNDNSSNHAIVNDNNGVMINGSNNVNINVSTNDSNSVNPNPKASVITNPNTRPSVSANPNTNT